jgi:hypothetical protein
VAQQELARQAMEVPELVLAMQAPLVPVQAMLAWMYSSAAAEWVNSPDR